MSLRKGGPKVGKPNHQNTFAFMHNKHSKKSEFIMAMAGGKGMCRKCRNIIEWKKQYRKYKVLKAPSKCAWCSQKTVLMAYNTVCKPCAEAKNVCAKCLNPQDSDQNDDEVPLTLKKLEETLKNGPLKERQKRGVLRAFERDLYPNSDIIRLANGQTPLNEKRTAEEVEQMEEEDSEAKIADAKAKALKARPFHGSKPMMLGERT